jgi:hypothetical protein
MVYRALLWLYPFDFRQQFSEEMISVFEQRAGERFANGEAVSFTFLLAEYTGIVKGAYVMWFSKILAFDRKQTSAGTTTSELNLEEAKTLRDLTIRKMVGAIAKHDFVAARRLSDEEAQLKHRIETLENPPSARRKLA